MSMITACLWIGRGIPAEFPERYSADDEEVSRISKLAHLHLDDAREELAAAKGEAEGEQSEDDDDGSGNENEDDDDSDEHMGDEDNDEDTNMETGVKLPSAKAKTKLTEADILAEYDLENYDEDDSDGADGEEASKMGEGTLSLFGKTRSLAFYESNADDPYITKAGEDSDEEEREELQILPTDNMVVAAKVEDEVPYLEVYVYEDGEDNLYVHHDVMLPSVPLCLEWIDLPVYQDKSQMDTSATGNFIAVGTMDPDIEIWDLDLVDSMYPNAILGAGSKEGPPTSAGVDSDTEGKGLAKPKRQSKSKTKSKHLRKPNTEYHTDAILCLAANRQHRNLLASASADKTIKLWDLTANTSRCAHDSPNIHTDKISSIAWNPVEATSLLSGSYDSTVALSDLRGSTPSISIPRWKVAGDVENVLWDRHQSHNFYVSTDQGRLYLFDSRRPTGSTGGKGSKGASMPIWTLHAHDKSISTIDVHHTIPGFLVTGSADQTVKIWNVADARPNMIASRNLGVGEVFSARFGPDTEVGWRLGVAGSEGALQVWDTSTNAGVRGTFWRRAKASKEGVDEVEDAAIPEERIVGIRLEEDDSSDDEDGGEGEAKEDAWVDE